MSKFYITTAIAYANAAPHMGHALESIQADALARYRRAVGDDVYFLTGTDEHGIKIVRAAAAAGQTPAEFTAANSAAFRAMREEFTLSWDDFIQTSDRERHFPAVTALWQRLVAAGDLYQQDYTGLYCSGCEEFKRETDLIEGKCEVHQREPEVVSETNWFFRLSRYSEQILTALESGEVALVPSLRKAELLNLLREGLHDISFSRPAESLGGWGVPVPGDPTQLMYVWCDALTNYISALGYGSADESRLQRYWPADCHMVGKDIVRFHAGVWLGMLLAAGLPLPRQIYIHGFVTSSGAKMSKSLGNVVDPVALAREWGADVLRYYLLAEIPSGQDGDYSPQRFAERYSSDLANGLGNLVSRVIAMAHKVSPDFTIEQLDPAAEQAAATMRAGVASHMAEYDFRRALAAIWELVTFANQYVDTQKPWELTEPAARAQTLGTLLELLRQLALALAPFLPTTAERIAAALGVEQAADTAWGSVPRFTLTRPEPLFPRRD
jgi:methionyl-tRNA synthetase